MLRVAALVCSIAGLAGALRPSRRDVLAAPLAAAAAAVAPRPARGVVAGPAASLADARASGAVALWIDLTDCDICRHDVPAACTGTLIADDLVLSAQHCVDVPESTPASRRSVFHVFQRRASSDDRSSPDKNVESPRVERSSPPRNEPLPGPCRAR